MHATLVLVVGHVLRWFAPGLVLLSCTGEPDSPPPLGPECRALIEAARGARECDPALGRLADAVALDPEPARCRRAVRTVLQGPSAVQPRVRSIFEMAPGVDAQSVLSDQELAALAELRHPATIELRPDVSPVPGIAPTSGDIDALSLEVEASGRLHAQVAPGRRNLRVQHAGQEAIYCVDLRPCETLTVTVHGAKLAHHASVSPGECP